MCIATQFDKSQLLDCNDWIYDTSVYATTFVAEENIICKDSWKAPLSQSIFFFGVLVKLYKKVKLNLLGRLQTNKTTPIYKILLWLLSKSSI